METWLQFVSWIRHDYNLDIFMNYISLILNRETARIKLPYLGFTVTDAMSKR